MGSTLRDETALRTRGFLSEQLGRMKILIQLPFSYLNALVAEYSDILLPALNQDYADQAIGVLQSETETITDQAATLARLASEFARLADHGQGERVGALATLGSLDLCQE